MSRSSPNSVIPAKAGTHGGLKFGQPLYGTMGPGLRWDDGTSV